MYEKIRDDDILVKATGPECCGREFIMWRCSGKHTVHVLEIMDGCSSYSEHESIEDAAESTNWDDGLLMCVCSSELHLNNYKR